MKYYAVVISIEEYHNSERISRVDFAENDAKEIKQALLGIGYLEEDITYLIGNKATKTAIENALIKTSKIAQNSDQIIVYYAGHGFNDSGINLISCVDTDLGALGLTCITITRVLEILNDSESKRIILFLDCCHSGIEFKDSNRGGTSVFSNDDLKYQFSDIEFLTCFASCKGDEKSWPDRSEKHGIWTNFLLNALRGDAEDVYDSGLLFSDSLQKYLLENTRQRAREITTKKAIQTPIKYGKETGRFIVGDVSRILQIKNAERRSNEISVADLKIYGTEEGRVRNLPGFISGRHKEPKENSSYHENWIRSISEKLIQDDVDEVGKNLKDILKLKKKQIQNVSVGSGTGEIVTNYFDYTIEVKQSKDDSSKYVVRRTLENISEDFDATNNKLFDTCFKNIFDTLLFPLNGALSVDSIINKVEDIDDDNIISVDYDVTDPSYCIITVPEMEGQIIVRQKSIRVRAARHLSPSELIATLQMFNNRLIESDIKLIE